MSFIDVLRGQYSTLPLVLTPADCTGRTYIVTGANIGIGFETASHLVHLGAHRVIMAVRSPTRGTDALNRLEADLAADRRGVAELWTLDLGSYDSTRSFAARVEAELDRVDGIVQNAAGANAEWFQMEGLESTIAVNLIGTMLLTVLLMPHMRLTATRYSVRPVVQIVTSTLGFSRKSDLAKIGNTDDILRDISDQKKWTTDGVNRYALSKLLQIMATRRLAALAPSDKTGIIVNYVSPGLCNTGLSRNSSLPTKFSVGALRIAMGRNAEWGSRNVLHGLSLGDESHGSCWHIATSRNWIPEWITNRNGEEWCRRVWDAIAAELERVQPGCVVAALEKIPAS